jgi:hypothetical protein
MEEIAEMIEARQAKPMSAGLISSG